MGMTKVTITFEVAEQDYKDYETCLDEFTNGFTNFNLETIEETEVIKDTGKLTILVKQPTGETVTKVLAVAEKPNGEYMLYSEDSFDDDNLYQEDISDTENLVFYAKQLVEGEIVSIMLIMDNYHEKLL